MSKSKKEEAAEETVEDLKKQLAESQAELEALREANAPPQKPSGALYLRPSADGKSYDRKYVNERYDDRVKAVRKEGWLPEKEVEKAKKKAK